MDEEVEEELKMWEISIDLMDGEHEYDTSIYFFGSYEDAERYANSYMNDFFGEGETEYDDRDDAWYSDDGQVAASLNGIWEFRTITAMTAKGAFSYEMEFSLI